MSPIGVGFIEQSPEGIFHCQNLRLRSGFRCVENSDSHSQRQSLLRAAATLDAPQLDAAIGRALDSADLELLWVPVDLGTVVLQSVLEVGKHALCGLPIMATADAWRRLIEQQQHSAAARVFVAAIHRWDRNFLTVRDLTASERLGTLIDVGRISRQFVPAELSQPRSPERNASSQTPEADSAWIQDWETRTFALKWFEMLDELLLLVPSDPQSVWAQSCGAGKRAWIKFANGCQAHVELQRRSLTQLETGWILEGTVGGFAAGRRFRAADDFELIDVPVDEVPTNQAGFYNSLEATIQQSEEFPVTNESILNVLLLRDAIEASIQTGTQVEPVGRA